MAIVFFGIATIVIILGMQRLAQQDGVSDSLYVPDWQADTVADIDFSVLAAEGVRCLAIDIDRTLVSHGEVELTGDTRRILREERERGRIEKLAIATNRVAHSNVLPLADSVGADVIMHAQGWRRKPARSYYETLLQKLGCAPEETAMVGDKLWQDVYGANRVGLRTVLVEPLGPQAWFDWLLLSQWRQRRHLDRLLGG